MTGRIRKGEGRKKKEKCKGRGERYEMTL